MKPFACHITVPALSRARGEKKNCPVGENFSIAPAAVGITGKGKPQFHHAKELRKNSSAL